MDAKQLAGLTDAELLAFAFRELSLITAVELAPASEADRARGATVSPKGTTNSIGNLK